MQPLIIKLFLVSIWLNLAGDSHVYAASELASTAATCPLKRRIVDIPTGNPAVDGDNNALVRRLMREVNSPNTTVRLGKDLVLNFAGFDNVSEHPLVPIARCVTLRARY